MRSHQWFVAAAVMFVVGLVFLWTAPGWNSALKWRWQYRWLFGFALLVGFIMWTMALEMQDPTAEVALALVTVRVVVAWLIGWTLLRSVGARSLPRQRDHRSCQGGRLRRRPRRSQ